MNKILNTTILTLVLILTTTVFVSANTEIVDGTVAHWKFESSVAEDGKAVNSNGLIVVKDITGNGNDLVRYNYGNVTEADLIWSKATHENSTSNYSIRFTGSREKDGGSCLRTIDNAPVNSQQFRKGYTIELLFQITPEFNADLHKWMGILTRTGSGKDAGFTEGEVEVSLASLGVSNLQELQWTNFPTNTNNNLTNWSWELSSGWHHVAIVNDGIYTTMYVDGSPVMRNPDEESNGIYTLNKAWNIGASEWNNSLDAIFNGYISEIRIVDHEVESSDWLIN